MSTYTAKTSDLSKEQLALITHKQTKVEMELQSEISELKKKQVEKLKKFIESCCICGSMGPRNNICLFCDQLKELEK